MSGQRILAIDDDAMTRAHLADFLSARGYEVECLDSGEDVVGRLVGARRPSLMLLDIIMPGCNGLDILADAKALPQPPPIIVLSAVGHVSTVMKAARLGAADYLLKPYEDRDLEQAIQNVLGANGHNSIPIARAAESGPELRSENPRMLRVREIASLVADTDVPVLISGESGVGKEVIARFIHASSGRRQPMIKVNCAALPAELLESELFGHERGAFTGAVREKPGKFELAEGGAIFLDEIAEMSPHLQAKLLHVLQDGEFTRLGGTSLRRADARILAATNKPLQAAVAKGEFRADLFFRLNVIHLEIPPLRERMEDLPLLIDLFLEKYGERYGNQVPELPRRLIDTFQQYHWPGNVRQLENVIRRFLILRDANLVIEDLKVADDPPAASKNLPIPLKERSAMAAEQTEKDAILRALEETHWNRKEAARRLGMCYKSLLQKLRKWGIAGRGIEQAPSADAEPERRKCAGGTAA